MKCFLTMLTLMLLSIPPEKTWSLVSLKQTAVTWMSSQILLTFDFKWLTYQSFLSFLASSTSNKTLKFLSTNLVYILECLYTAFSSSIPKLKRWISKSSHYDSFTSSYILHCSELRKNFKKLTFWTVVLCQSECMGYK